MFGANYDSGWLDEIDLIVIFVGVRSGGNNLNLILLELFDGFGGGGKIDWTGKKSTTGGSDDVGIE